MDNKKLILLENKDQALEYLKNKERFRDFLPVSFSFDIENLFSKKNLNFLMEESYETNSLYNGIHKSSFNSMKKICNKLKIDYKGINLMSLVDYEIYLILTSSKKYLKLLKKIIRVEKPKKIALFKNNFLFYSNPEYNNFIIPLIFKNEIRTIPYSKNKKKLDKRDLLKMFGYIQKIFTKLKLKLSSSKNNKIFIFGGETYFKSLVKLLLENKNNKIFNMADQLRKSFFINKKYITFYEFSGKKSSGQKKLERTLITLKEKINKINFSKEFKTEKELETILKKKLISLINTRFLVVVKQINEIRDLMQNKKIDLVLLSEDSSPFAQSVVKTAKQFNIPSILFQHGFFNHEIGYHSISNYTFASGEKVKKEYIKQGAIKKGVEVIGCPRYDEFFKKKVKKGEKIILYGMEVTNGNEVVAETHLTKKRQKEILRMLFRCLKKFPEYKLIIKTRPGWEMASLPKLIAKQENFENFEVVEKADNLELMNNSEIIITNRSTFGIEALFLNKPVISIYFKTKYNPYEKMKAIKIVYTEKQLIKAIQENMNHTKNKVMQSRKIWEKWFIRNPRASERALKKIEEILKIKSEKGVKR